MKQNIYSGKNIYKLQACETEFSTSWSRTVANFLLFKRVLRTLQRLLSPRLHNYIIKDQIFFELREILQMFEIKTSRPGF